MMYKINPQSFNAVMACAGTNDVRYYLNAFFIDVTNDRIVAINGHVLATAPITRVDSGVVDVEPDTHGPLKGFLFQRLQRPISNKGETVYINCADKVVQYRDGAGTDKQVDLETVEARYVDYTPVEYKGEHTEIETIAFNADYIAKPARWAGFDYCCAVFDFHGQRNAMGVCYQEPSLADVRITLMPARI